MWSDSSTVLAWLSSEKKLPVFVANRVAEILDTTTINSWRHVKGDINPANLATRGLTINQISDSTWLHGPTWIKIEDQWPKKLKVNNVELEVVEETCLKVTIIEHLVVWHKFSNFKRLQNTIAYCIRAIEKDKPKNLIITAEEKMKATKAMAKRYIEWRFNPPNSPHFVRVWERLEKFQESNV